jgi:recombination protein RecR
MRIARAVQNLVEAFERLPGIGPKSAQRLTYYLLHVPQGELDKLGLAVTSLKANTKECGICHNIGETDPCDICTDSNRDKSVDVMALDRGNEFNGVYHVLHGVIDPLHNIGPDEIKIHELLGRTGVEEIVLALNPNMEGEATCLYIKRLLNEKGFGGKVTRLAHGLPVGADIEYADDVTLTRAMEGRRDY